ncbi:unnamed protein product, partial [Tetraodon nigroviridis]
MKAVLQFDYVLVVDTEGLRSQELAGESTLHRDNELATFVIGLGDVTLINIFGENPSEMQDVLQIVVQAFMRMKEVGLSPRCVFVHQNVTDVAAAERNMEGRRRLQERLDKMAQLAAEEEGFDAQSFSKVISFNVHEDVKYFAQLWEGSPPMAPPNPGYSESVQDLKDFIISKASRSTGISLSQFKAKVLDLWNALLNENFVFSFKNTYEISVYRKLEVEYGTWTWTLRNKMVDIENQLYTQIENGRVETIRRDDLHKKINEAHADSQGLSHEEMIRDFIRTVEEEALTTIQSKPVETKGYNITYLQEVAMKVNTAVSEFQRGKKYALKKEFTVDLALYVFDRSERWLKDSHRRFKDNNDVFVYAESKKEQFKKAFTAFCKGSSSAVVFAELICDQLKRSITEAVGNDSARNLADEMRCNHPAFKGNRMNLEKHVLRSLAENEDFGGFMTYIHNPKKHVETFITQEVEKYIKENKVKVENILRRNVEDITKLLKQALHDATA